MIDLLRISEILGYNEVQYPEFAISTARQNVIEERVLELTTIDDALKQARLNSVADSIGDIRLQFRNHISLLKEEGSRILKEISNLSGIPLEFDRYRGKPRPMSFTSYYG